MKFVHRSQENVMELFLFLKNLEGIVKYISVVNFLWGIIKTKEFIHMLLGGKNFITNDTLNSGICFFDNAITKLIAELRL